MTAETVAEAEVYTNNLDLSGYINFNMYLGLNEYGDIEGYTFKAYLQSSVDDDRNSIDCCNYHEITGTTVSMTGSEYQENIRFQLPLTPAELTDKIRIVASIFDADNQLVEKVEAEMSIVDYVARMFTKYGESNDDLTDMMAALIHYGSAAQRYFGYNTENIADDIFNDEAYAAYKDRGRNAAVSYEEKLADTALIDKDEINRLLQEKAPELTYTGTSLDHSAGMQFHHFFTVKGITAQEAKEKYEGKFTVSGGYAMTITVVGKNQIRVDTDKIPPASLCNEAKFIYSMKQERIIVILLNTVTIRS